MSLFADILNYSLLAIFSLESAIPQPGVGATKKEVVLSGVESIVKASSTGATTTGHADVGAIVTAAGGFINATVAILKAAKIGPFGTPPVLPPPV